MRAYLLTTLSVAACVLALTSAQAKSGSGVAPLAAKPLALLHPIAQQHDGDRASSLVLYTSDDPNVGWNGWGSATKTVSLCVASATGRYRLLISSRMGGAAHGRVRIPYTITFTDSVGAQQTASTDHSSILAFDGSVSAGANCLDGPNATLSIKMDERSLLSGVAGDYADSLQFSVAAR